MHCKISHDKRSLYKILFIEYPINKCRYGDISYTIAYMYINILNIVIFNY